MKEIAYNQIPDDFIQHNDIRIPVFLCNGRNRDEKTIDSFGEEWNAFSSFSESEIETIGRDYFDLINLSELKDARCLDIGCGSGRWSRFLAPYAGSIYAVDPSKAVLVAALNLKDFTNCHVAMAEVDNLPFPDHYFDFIYSLGVLHHIPDTEKALKACVSKLKNGGTCLLYLYYSLENRSVTYKAIFQASNILRKMVSRLPSGIKRVVTDLLAIFIYLPFIALSWVIEKLAGSAKADSIPLNYYRKTSWTVIRNDALDRFGTPLEQRFTKDEIEQMMTNAGLTDIEFSPTPPFWHVIGRKN